MHPEVRPQPYWGATKVMQLQCSQISVGLIVIAECLEGVEENQNPPFRSRSILLAETHG